jgi:hypothetical protein
MDTLELILTNPLLYIAGSLLCIVLVIEYGRENDNFPLWCSFTIFISLLLIFIASSKIL